MKALAIMRQYDSTTLNKLFDSGVVVKYGSKHKNVNGMFVMYVSNTINTLNIENSVYGSRIFHTKSTELSKTYKDIIVPDLIKHIVPVKERFKLLAKYTTLLDN